MTEHRKKVPALQSPSIEDSMVSVKELALLIALLSSINKEEKQDE